MAQDPYKHPVLEDVTLPEVLQALGDPVRLSILRALAPGEETAWSGFCVDMAPSTLSHHMKVLRNAGLVVHRRDGTRCLVSLRSNLAGRFPGLLDAVLGLIPVATPGAGEDGGT